jgi:F-type H+-transporting ATPase subunit alpha
VLVIFAATNGYLVKSPVSVARRYEVELYRFMDARHPEILKQMAEKKDIKGELTDKIKAALEELAGVFQAEPMEKAS